MRRAGLAGVQAIAGESDAAESEESEDEQSVDEADDGSDDGKGSSPAVENGVHVAAGDGSKRKRGSRASSPQESAGEEPPTRGGGRPAEGPRRKRLRKVGE